MDSSTVLVERARVETLASRHLPGMALNLSRLEFLLPAEATLHATYRELRALLKTCCDEGGLTDPRAFRSFLQTTVLYPFPVGKGQGAYQNRALHWIPEPERGQSPEEAPLGTLASEPDASHPHDPETGTGSWTKRGTTQPLDYLIFDARWDLTEDRGRRLLNQSHSEHPEPSSLSPALVRRTRCFSRLFLGKLQSKDVRRWERGTTDGYLDPGMLSKFATGQLPLRVFRKREPAESESVAITFLVDQSGSTQGPLRSMMMLAMDFTLTALEGAGIATEVLGYTTRFGGKDKHNPIHDEWMAAGCPKNVGRLNAVHHRIYKAYGRHWSFCRRRLSSALATEVGKENLDGEALLWAATRMRQRPEKRKLLVVLSDGTPADPATEEANGSLYLEAHLFRVIRILGDWNIGVGAVGTGCGPERFYPHSRRLFAEEDVPEAMFDVLSGLLWPGGGPR